jgi:hypothetical protein
MKLVILMIAVIAGVSVAALARELGHLVHPKDGQNVVAGSDEKLDFRLTAERDENGTVLVEMRVPPGSTLQQAAYLRLEITKDKQILLWTRLASRKDADGTLKASFQIHESLARDAFVVAAYEPQGQGQARNLSAYHVPLAEYIKDRKAPQAKN